MALCVPVSTVRRRRVALPADLQELLTKDEQKLLPRLVGITQDPWHVINRILRPVPKDDRQRKPFEADVRSIAARRGGTAKDSSTSITAGTVKELQNVCIDEARGLQGELIELIHRYRSVAAQNNAPRDRQQKLGLALEYLGSSKTATGVASGDESSLQVSQSVPISLSEATRFDHVRAEEVSQYKHPQMHRPCKQAQIVFQG